MTTVYRKFISIVLVVFTMFSLASPVMAENSNDEISPKASAYIASVWAETVSNDGTLTVNFSITATSKMTSLGSTIIEIRNSAGTTIKVFSSDSTSGMMGSNSTYHSGSVSYSWTTSGARYYAVVYFEAQNGSGYDTTSYTTAYVVA